MIRASNLSFSYGPHRVLHEINLVQNPGRVLGLVGPNGSGKSTLIRNLGGSLKPEAGQVSLGEKDLADYSSQELARTVSMVVQERDSEPGLTVAQMVMLGRTPHLGLFARPGAQDQEIVLASLESVGAVHLAQRFFAELSGGEKQRVLIARALAQSTPYILLDEPTNHLDIRHQHELLRLVRASGRETVIVLHDLNLAARYCDDVALLDRGRLVAQGSADEILSPDYLEPVYSIGVHRLAFQGTTHLIFEPRDEESTA
ncbi:ABC transporter ATP-binding protein [Rothia aerolata]|uniref:ABC transporter ATPase n=1 Tax=Rothia aerolata TaxID=1812262 RepID=A0A917IQB0_9MICC|nr:ABC transporter ATP-binding protein [Rothia aerolata]GGH58688.1 ABC transporter ATPase [Rothia aerolata]